MRSTSAPISDSIRAASGTGPRPAISITFPKGTTQQQAEPIIARFAEAAHNIGGCGGAEKIATDFHGEVVQAEKKMRELPPTLQQMMLSMQVGQATQPFGSPERLSVLIMCGRDDPPPVVAPNPDQIQTQMEEARVARRAQRYLRDLRRDAVVDYR